MITYLILVPSFKYYSIERKAIMSFRWYRAQGLVEYALILMLVALVVLVMLAIFGPAVGNMYSEVISQI